MECKESIQKALEYADHNGFVVFDRVASEEQLAVIDSKFWDYAEACSPLLKRTDPKTWTNSNWPQTFSTGIFSYHGVGQSPHMWFVRTLPRFREAFQHLYKGETKRRVSFDGCGAVRGGEHDFKANDAWLHIDHNFNNGPDTCWQAFLQSTQCDSPKDHGSFICIPGSHKTNAARFKTDKEFQKLSMGRNRSKHFIMFDVEDEFVYNSKEIKWIQMKPGQALFWRSALTHANKLPTTKTVKGGMRRRVDYVSMQTSASGEKEEDLTLKQLAKAEEESKNLTEKRFEACKNAFTTTHVVTKPVDNHPGRPRHATFAPMNTPAFCYKTDFTVDEERLVRGM